MRPIIPTIVAALIAGCASTVDVPPAEVPVAVSCVKDRPMPPALRTTAEILAMDDYGVILALRVELMMRDKYIGELSDIVDACERAPDVVTVPR